MTEREPDWRYRPRRHMDVRQLTSGRRVPVAMQVLLAVVVLLLPLILIRLGLVPGGRFSGRRRRPPPELNGRLLAGAGDRPLPLCEVRLLGTSLPPVLSDADGQFSLPTGQLSQGQLPEPALLLVRDADGELAAVVRAEPYADTPAEHRVHAAVSLSGGVKGSDGSPAVEVGISLAVSLQGSSGELTKLPFASVSDAAGRFAFTGLPANCSYGVTTGEGNGFAPVTAFVAARELAAPGVDLGWIVLPRNDMKVAGLVRDEYGMPVGNASVEVVAAGAATLRSRTNVDGSFRVEGVREGEVTISATRGTARDAAESRAGDMAVTLDLVDPNREPPRVDVRPARLGADFDARLAYYWCDFEDAHNPLSEWNSNQRFTSHSPRVRTLLGRFGRMNQVSVALSGLPEHHVVRLYVEVVVFGRWSGNSSRSGTPDLMQIRVADGPRLACGSLGSHSGCKQSFPLPFRAGEFAGGTGGYKVTMQTPGRTDSDAFVFPMLFTFRHDSASLGLLFNSVSAASLKSRSWALDNVGIQLLDSVPEAAFTAVQLRQTIDDLGNDDCAVALAAVQRLVACGDAGAAAVGEALGWHGEDASEREALVAFLSAFDHDDRRQWEEALEVCRELGVRAAAACDYRIDRRRARGELPNWFSQAEALGRKPRPRTESELRLWRSAWVLEQMWTPQARALLCCSAEGVL